MPSEATTNPQRLWPRWLIAVSRPVRVDLGPAGAGQLVDISGGGIRVQSLAPLRRGAELPLRIDIPDRLEPVQGNGIVVWSKPNGAAGIRFTTMSDAQQKALRSWLDDLERAATNPPESEPQDEFTTTVSKIRAAQLNNADALKAIARRATELGTINGAAIAIGTTENMVRLAIAGTAPELGTPIAVGEGLAGDCILRRKMVYCQNAANDPRISHKFKFGSALILPLLVNGEVRGVLEAFAPQAQAFDSQTTEALERLTDAAIFISYGIIPQRKTAPPKMPPTSTSVGMKAFNPSASQTIRAASPTPAPSQSSNTGSFAAYPATQPKPPVVPMTPKPVVHAPAASAPAPVRTVTPQPAPKTENFSVGTLAEMPAVQEREKETQVVKVTPKFEWEAEPRQSSAGKWIGVAVAVMILAAVPLWFFVLKPKTAKPAGEVSTVSSPAVTSSPVTTQVPIPVPQPALETPAASIPSMPVEAVAASKPVTLPSFVPKSSAAQPAKQENKPEPVEPAKSAPAPIVLAGHAAPKVPPQAEIAAPVAPPPVVATTSVSNLALPAAGGAVPKLTAELAKSRTGGALIHRVDTVYPQFARNARIQGEVELQFRITKDGTVDQIRKVSGHPILADAAVEAVRRWRYDPVKINGQPVSVESSVKLNFSLTR